MMASVTEECLVVAPQQPQVPEVADTGSTVTINTDAVVASSDAFVVSPDGVIFSIKKEIEVVDSIKPGGNRSGHLPVQVSLPPELVAKLGRQESSDSVGSMEEEGIQADSAPDGPDAEGQDTQDGSELEPRSERSSSVVSDGSEEGGRDSGIEAEREPDMVVPDQDLMTRIVAQVEFYFSDANVAKDKFLLKHIRRNKEGYVSLKLVSSFKKVKQLTKDWRVVAHSLSKCSSKIQINDLGTKIRRVEPLPDLEEVPITCAVLVLSLPLEKPNIQSVSELFSSCGEIAFIRVVRTGSAIPQDLKSLAVKHPELTDTNCAWVEFETPEAAKAATEMSNEDGMKVVPILPEAQKKQEKTQQQKGSQPNSRKNSVSNIQQQRGPASRKNSTAGGKARKDSTSGLSSEGEYSYPQPRIPRRKCLSLPQTQSPNLRELSAVVEARRNRPKSKSCTEFQLGSPPSSSSWVQRHLLAAAAASAASAASPVVGSRPPFNRPARISQGSLPLPNGVVRFPKGPDGSRGFKSEVRRRTSNAAEDSNS
ncbi:la-related protein 6-like [Homarus americanus]|uniref:La-related protein 6-like 1 n=1 Tax=Homarus americanus TaxID=6706 RepID=A0A8J5TL77_HOMAM|nr:la-related protein 6-like [Homarus americanus]KAG7174422.1 La-related protein 6-like 1 [Homarus americanus]